MIKPKTFSKTDRRSRRRLQQLVRRRYIQETEIVKNLPALEYGGHLEQKRGKLCLRRADTINANRDGTFTVMREWMRPPKYGWNQDFYAVKSPNVPSSAMGASKPTEGK